jgi:hypothetical protein
MKPPHLLALGLLPASAACSALMSKAPPARVDPASYIECGVAPGALVADVLIAGLTGTLLALSFADEGDVDGGPVVVAAAVSIGFGVSAAHGLAVRGSCERARLQAAPGLDARPLVLRPAAGAPALLPAPLTPPPGAPLPGPPPPAPDAGVPDAHAGG